MGDIQYYQSSLSDPNSRKLETFSYLPEMNNDGLIKQIQYILNQGWYPMIEYTEPEHASDHYWYMWKLPMFGETDAEKILAEATACHKIHTAHHIRLVAYDHYKQTQTVMIVIFRGMM